MRLLVLSICVSFACGDFFDTYTGVKIPRRRFEELRNVNLVPWCAIEVTKCEAKEPRRLDLGCNSLRYPSRGAVATPFRRMLPAIFNNGKPRLSASGRALPPARALRVAIMSDGRVASRTHTQMVANYGALVTGDVTSVHDTVNYVGVTTDCCQPSRATDPDCAPIAVSDDDPHLRASNVRCLNLTTPITYQDLGCVSADVPPERINMAAPMLELSSVYGNEAAGAAKGRLWEAGRMRAEMLNGKEWPPSGSPLCVNNEPPNETRCHDSASGGSNALLGINLLFLWYFRQHNAIAKELEALNPCWDDDKLFYTAREINIAYFNQIFYYEYLPEIMGYKLLVQKKVIFKTSGHVDDYDPALEPRLSIEYTTGTRWFHTIQEGRLKFYSKDGVLYDEKGIVDLTLRTGFLAINNTLAGMTQGAFRQAGAAADGVIDPDIGTRILGRLQFVSDVLASDIMKGRLLGLPPYNQYRRRCGLAPAHNFHDLRQWMNDEQVDALSQHYESVEDIDLMAGMAVERGEGALVPPTLACLMVDQLQHWRRSDRFWYEHPDHPQAFTTEQLREIRKMTTSVLMCSHGDDVTAIQSRPYRLPGPGNEIVPCSQHHAPDLYVFADVTCAGAKRHTSANPFAKYKQ